MVSVIVPVYNTDAWLEACIESVLAQSLPDWQLVLVDDGSTDRSGRICDRYAAADSRILVVHQPNAGVSAARNTGIARATGQWLTFVDSDDRLMPDALTVMLDAAVAADADIVAAGWTTDKGVAVTPDHRICDRGGLHYFFTSGINFGYVWAKLYRRTLFVDNDVRFPVDVHWAEDVLVTDTLIALAGRVVFIPDSVYGYTVRDGSGVSRLHSYDSELKGYLMALDIMPRLDGLLPSKRCNSAFGFLWRVVLTIYRDHPDRPSRLKALKSLPIDVARLWHRPTNTKEAVITWLLLHRWLRAFDLLMSHTSSR